MTRDHHFNPFQESVLEFDEDTLEPIFEFKAFGTRDDRFTETQREYFYRQNQMRLSESLDKSEKLLCETLIKLYNMNIKISVDESIEQFLARANYELLEKGVQL